MKWTPDNNFSSILNTYRNQNKKRYITPSPTDHIAGDNSHGFANITEITEILNGQRFKYLKEPIASLIQSMFPISPNSIVQATKQTNNKLKPRILITVDNNTKGLSVKTGSGNSFHQENIFNFIDYCISIGMTQKEKTSFLEAFWADGTTDGTGCYENRINDKTLTKSIYEKQLIITNAFFNKHRKELLSRFLQYGNNPQKPDTIHTDYLYYGTANDGYHIPMDFFIDYLISENISTNGLFTIGPMSLQMWNRNLENDPQKDYKRFDIQVKFINLKQTVINAHKKLISTKRHGTAFGRSTEYELVYDLNSNKDMNNNLWKPIIKRLNLKSLDDIWAIRSTKMVENKIINKKVLPKTDIFLIKTKAKGSNSIDNYWIDDNSLENIDYGYVAESGISCKNPDSKSFTYAKFSLPSFEAIIGNKYLGCGAMLFIEKECDALLNNKILSDNNISKSDLYNYLSTEVTFKINITYQEFDLTNTNIAKQVKDCCLKNIESIINATPSIAEKIFLGTGLFEDPYSINYIYSYGHMNEAVIPENFTITTGSGRHRGKYTIIFKP